MLVIDDAKLPPPTPAVAAAISSIVNDTPGFRMIAMKIVGMSSRAAEMMVKLRPPKVATAKVYGSRSTAPTSVGSAVSRNLPAGSMWYSGHEQHQHRPQAPHRESDVLGEDRAGRGCGWRFGCGRLPEGRSSGRQSSIQWPRRRTRPASVDGAGAAVVTLVSVGEVMVNSRVRGR